jgi:hypothetical protein
MKYYLKVMVASLAIISFIHFTAKAQDTETKQARIGIKGGVNFSALYTNGADLNKMRTGFNLGVFAKLRISDHVAFQPELYYISKGAEVSYNNSVAYGTAIYHFNYLEMPLLCVVNITQYFNILAGPYAALLLNGKAKNGSDADNFDFEKNVNSDDYNKLDAGIALGGGVDFKAASLGIRYSQGLTTIGKAKDFTGTSYTFPDAKNGVISICIAVTLN